MTNKQLIFKKRPTGYPDAQTWSLETNETTEPKEGEVLIEQHYISLDPAMRGWMNEGKSYIEPVELDAVMRAGSIGNVIESKHPKFEVGDCLTGWGGVQQYVTTNAETWHKVDPSVVSMPKYLSVLGMTGMTAYFGIIEVGQINKGDSVLISGAAGAVGSIVGQIAKIKGCRVVGIAGGKEKCEYLTNELGFDAAIDYKSDDMIQSLKEHCPKGVDVFFDNVGGEILDLALTQLRRGARVVICGAISQYNNKARIKGPSNYLSLLVNRATMQGMVVFDYADQYGVAAKQLGKWLAEGKIKSKEAVYEGIENFQDTYDRLFTGEKLGKLVLKVKE
ncbi:MAG: NADP-dependent oxidoreductase [Aquaticitalea sp.]